MTFSKVIAPYGRSVAATLFGFGVPELIEGLEFDDANLSLEVAVNWHIIVDAALRLYSEDWRYEVALIGRNLSDKIYALGTTSEPRACVNQGPPAVA